MKTATLLILLASYMAMGSERQTNEPLINTKNLAQVGIIVKDIEKASQHWANVLGIEPPQANEVSSNPDRPMKYKGEISTGSAKLAFIQLENIQIELIQPLGGNSTWQQFLDQHGEGIHHIGFWIKDIDGLERKFEMAGMPVEQRGGWETGAYSYMDANAILGCTIELLENFNSP